MYRLKTSPRRQRGMSIVELMVGVAIGLTITAAATLMVASQLSDSRRLLLETQIQQDLRATADQVAREVRRCGFWHDAHMGTSTGAGASTIRANPYGLIGPAGSDDPDADAVASQEITCTISAATSPEDNVVSAAENRGFRLNDGVIESQLGAGNWQALTDAATLRVTRFDVTPTVQQVALACPRACSAGGTPCPPRVEIRAMTIDIAGQAVNDAAIQRSVRAQVRLRNDAIVGECRD